MIKEKIEYIKTDIADFHSHVLPEMDDGSRSAEESVLMLGEAARQGITRMVSTPHFYAGQNSPQSFLSRREASVKKLKNAVNMCEFEIPKLYIGAEVAFYPGMRYSDDVPSLCIYGTRYILIEMPFYKWSAAETNEIIAVSENFGLVPIIAHIERYLSFGNEKYLKELSENGALLQSNAEFFIQRKTRKKALKSFRGEFIDLIGSDCHNMLSRPPLLGNAIYIMKNSLSNDCISRAEFISDEILSEAQSVL